MIRRGSHLALVASGILHAHGEPDHLGRRKLRDCVICEESIFAQPHQSDDARTCSPGCARTLAYREFPNLDGFHSKLRARLAGIEP
jgi:hypothetical protein